MNLFQDNDSMMTLKEIFGKTSTIGPMEVNETHLEIWEIRPTTGNQKNIALEYSIARVHTLPPQNFRIVVKQLAHNENGYRDVLKEIFMSESNLIVLDCEKKILEEVLKQCQQVSTDFFFHIQQKQRGINWLTRW